MTAPRVSEEECELACSYFHNYGLAKDCISRLLAERSALEARLAEARRKNEAMADFYYDACAKRMVGEDGFVRSLAEARRGFAEEALKNYTAHYDNFDEDKFEAWLRAVAEGKG